MLTILSPSTALLLLSGTVLQCSAQSANRFDFFNLETPLSGPCDLVEGHDGALWGEAILKNIIFRIDPASGAVDEYAIPFTTPLSNQTIPDLPVTGTLLEEVQSRTALSCAIRKGDDGHLYASNGLRNQLLQINETTKHIKVLQPPVNPLGDLQPFNDLYSAKDGIYFTQTTANQFTFYDFASGTFTNHQVPTPLSLPLGLFVDSHGIVWIANMLSNQILRYDPKNGQIKEFPLPEPLQLPTVIRAEKDGHVYFALFTGNGIGRINQKTFKIDLYHTNEIGGIGAEDTIDSKGGVWYSFFDVDVMARLDTNTFQFDYVPFPDTFAATGVNGILGDLPPYVDVAINYGPGDAIWFASILENKVGKYDLTGLYS